MHVFEDLIEVDGFVSENPSKGRVELLGALHHFLDAGAFFAIILRGHVDCQQLLQLGVSGALPERASPFEPRVIVL